MAWLAWEAVSEDLHCATSAPDLNFDFTNHDLSIVWRNLNLNLTSAYSNHDLSIVERILNLNLNFDSSNHDLSTVKGGLTFTLNFDSSIVYFALSRWAKLPHLPILKIPKADTQLE